VRGVSLEALTWVQLLFFVLRGAHVAGATQVAVLSDDLIIHDVLLHHLGLVAVVSATPGTVGGLLLLGAGWPKDLGAVLPDDNVLVLSVGRTAGILLPVHVFDRSLEARLSRHTL
jgi:uncharacterized membrane protein